LALALHLVFHELTANASKFGALSLPPRVRQGRVAGSPRSGGPSQTRDRLGGARRTRREGPETRRGRVTAYQDSTPRIRRSTAGPQERGSRLLHAGRPRSRWHANKGSHSITGTWRHTTLTFDDMDIAANMPMQAMPRSATCPPVADSRAKYNDARNRRLELIATERIELWTTFLSFNRASGQSSRGRNAIC
jgi:hypothetical protein